MFLDGETPLPSIAMNRVVSSRGEYLCLQSAAPLRTLNSSPWGGGFGEHRMLINRQVDKLYNAADPLEEMDKFLRDEGLEPVQCASMLTAAYVKQAGYSKMSSKDVADLADGEELAVCAWVTTGLGNKARAGALLPYSSLYPGTINVILVVEGQMTDSCMVNAVITATEAKTAALQDLGVAVDGQSATGTTTDAVLVAATGRGRTLTYAGTATQLGYFIGRTVYEAIMESGRACVT